MNGESESSGNIAYQQSQRSYSASENVGIKIIVCTNIDVKRAVTSKSTCVSYQPTTGQAIERQRATRPGQP